jgi:hypothetical protein
MPKTAKPAAAAKRMPAAAKSAAAKPIPPTAKPARRRLEPEIAPLEAQPAEDPRRLLREAAWAKMFGRLGLNNPFGR